MDGDLPVFQHSSRPPLWRLPCVVMPILHAISGRDCVEAGLCPARTGQSPVTTQFQPGIYFGLSRCATFTLYPAFRSRLPTSSAIITERCWPPVHPKLMVR